MSLLYYVLGVTVAKRFRDRGRSEEKPARRRRKTTRKAKKTRKKAPK